MQNALKIDIDSTLDKNKKIQNEFINKLCVKANNYKRKIEVIEHKTIWLQKCPTVH